MNFHHYFKLFVSISILAILASCATPLNVIRMNPVSDDVTWNYGQAYASDTVSGVIVEAAFDNATRDYNIFDVCVVNKSDMEYLVDPSVFYFEEITTDTIDEKLIKAIDPEYMLLSMDKEASKIEADSKNAAIGAGIATGALLVASVAVAVADDEPHHHYDSSNDVYITTPLIFDGGDGSDETYEPTGVEQERERWASTTIRKTTLKPGFKIEGKMFFPRFEKSGTYLFKVPVDNIEASIPFMQIIYDPALQD
ncbi:MAG TPA: hypothetical protein VJ909_04630 [Prolixibacteraceae bacterium]|nr:hypothetical protein [Prolixibacteraceae bacterium]